MVRHARKEILDEISIPDCKVKGTLVEVPTLTRSHAFTHALSGFVVIRLAFQPEEAKRYNEIVLSIQTNLLTSLGTGEIGRAHV